MPSIHTDLMVDEKKSKDNIKHMLQSVRLSVNWWILYIHRYQIFFLSFYMIDIIYTTCTWNPFKILYQVFCLEFRKGFILYLLLYFILPIITWNLANITTFTSNFKCFATYTVVNRYFTSWVYCGSYICNLPHMEQTL